MHRFDLSDIPVIKQNVEYAASLSLPSNAFYRYIKDGYISNGMLYILCVSRNNETGVNTIILRLSLYPEIKISDMLKLAGDHTTLCVTPDYIFTFEGQEHIVRFKLKIENDKNLRTED
jgi:hypothetical protein